MSVPDCIAPAAISFQRNAGMLAKCYDGVPADEWQRRPNDSSNSLLWIAGHIVWGRSRTLRFLGMPWSRPWLHLFERGAKLAQADQYPSPQEILLAWKNVSESLTTAMEGAADDVLAAPAPPNSPSSDGKVSGMIGFLAFHETYHVGQASYVRRWLGYDQIVG